LTQTFMTTGFTAADFNIGTQSAYFFTNPALAVTYASNYQAGIVEVILPQTTYAAMPKTVQPYQGGPDVEVLVPQSGLATLNGAIRRLHMP
jgi:hypothetical protein